MTLRHSMKFLGLAAIICSVTAIAGCKTVSELQRHETAHRLASPAHMLKRQVDAGPFEIAIYERVYKNGEEATIYIEGDGNVRQSADGKIWTGHATPDNPVALHLATRDLSNNVIYIARPCQFPAQEPEDGPCSTNKYAGPERYSFETMEGMNTVLDRLKNRHGFSGYHLVGYGGGGTVATLLAAKRDDVLTLRTVSGNLDTELQRSSEGLPPLLGAMNPRDFAADLATMPQHHFIGEWDQETSSTLSTSFRDATGPSNCIRISTVAEADHEKGWVNRWPSLLQEPIDCNTH